MKGFALLLLGAVALAQAETQRTLSGKICNCNPDEAASVCSRYSSDEELIVHENCNQFYKCFNGQAIPFFCPANLLYNPLAETCDWPENVECGSRPIAKEGEEEECSQENGINDQDNNGGADSGTGNNGNGNDNPEEAPGICAADGSEGILVAHENCNQFYKCANGSPVAMNCPSGLSYSPSTEQCDWAEKVSCGDRPIIEIEGGGNNGDNDESCEENNNGNGESDGGNGDNGAGGGTCNCNPGEAPGICGADGSDGVLVAHENCNQFYKCANGVPVALNCNENLLYNPYTEQCDWPENVECGDRPIAEIDGGNGDNGSGNGNGDNGNGDNGSGNGNGENGGSCNCNPGEAPGICAAEGSDNTLVAHENCNQFYKCAHGIPVTLNCPPGLLYNPYIECCDWPHNVKCGDKPIIEIDNGGGDNGNGDNGNGDNGNGDNGNGENGNGNGDSGNGGNGNGTCNCNPGEAPGICAADGSDGILVAHENCNQFYKCDHGAPVTVTCPAGLVYNPYTECCDWPYNVECGYKPIVEVEGGNNGNGDNGNGDNGNGDNGSSGGNGNGENGGEENGNGNGDNGGTGTCNCNPEEAPGICAADGSGGILIAHENCNQFYKCDHGVPVAFNCNNGLLYNPYSQVCDWPENVDCGDKPIIEIEEGNNGSGDNGSSGGNGNGENGGEENGNGNGDNGGSGTCNCNPGEAPGICAADGSDNTLVAHENCNQFYKCAHGIPVTLNCPPGLLYNPYIECCDWPYNVECGDKPIIEIDNGGDDNGNGDNGNGDNGNGDNGNGENGNGNGDSGNGGNGNGTCNCNPGEAPGICAADGSDGILVAHENCNQFYKCDHGAPVTVTCPAGLNYNPYTECCDWPYNVECGEKPIVEVEGGNNGNGDNGNGDNGSSGGNGNGENGGEENGNGNGDNGGSGTCNCNPGEAPGICAADGSDGILIAHENCNQFYKCDHGVNVAFNCNNGLMYNPYSQVCDWPENVECGDKPIIEIEGGNNGSGDNGSSGGNGNGENGGEENGNGNGDNGGSGTCNCNPGEAPGICAADGSDGILIAHENCNQFYKCDHGVNVAFNCNNGLMYNPYSQVCDWPENVECGDKPIIEIEGGNNGSGDNGSSGGNGNGENGGEENGNGNGGTGTCNCNPEEAPAICATGGSEGVLIAHEKCNKFYKCSFGSPVAMACPSNLLYNPIVGVCDWPENVDCGGRIIKEDDNNSSSNNGGDKDDEDNNESDNNGGDEVIVGPNANPGEAPSICASSDSNGVLVAHENCDQFYVCSESSPVPLQCPSNLFYNPIIEQCDWPRNVDCGDRIVTDPKVEEGGICSCNSREAPSICAGSDSNGKMIAHENCSQYFVCFNGIPIARSCPSSLFYEPHTKQCNWPSAVSCDGRDVTSHFSLNKHMQARRGIF